jgi:hypothetical protein
MMQAMDGSAGHAHLAANGASSGRFVNRARFQHFSVVPGGKPDVKT